MSIRGFGLILVAGLLSGCGATWMLDSAPAADGSMYVVGQQGNSPAIWKCPKQPGAGQCQVVKVEE
jgi:hypothetical protein